MADLDALKLVGPLIGSAVGVAVGLIVVRRRRQESPGWQPAPWFRRVFVGLVGTFMLVAAIAGIAAGKPNQWIPALVAGLTSFVLLWSVEVAVRRQRHTEQSDAGYPSSPAESNEGPRVMK